MKKPSQWLSGKIIPGMKLGRKLGYPTVNIKDPSIMKEYKQGVYAAQVKISDTIYKAALYFGPNYQNNPSETVLEINIFDFNQDIYSEVISFQLFDFIRPPKKFNTPNKLKEQIAKDCKMIEKLLVTSKASYPLLQ